MAQQGHKDRLTAIDASFCTRRSSPRTCTSARSPCSRAHPPAREDSNHHLEGRLGRVPALPPEALRSRRSRPGGRLGRRPNLQPRLPRARHRPAEARQRRPARQLVGADLLAAARPLEATLGDLDRAGARGRPLRADLEDHHALVDGVAAWTSATVPCSTCHRWPDEPEPEIGDRWMPAPEPSDIELMAEGVAGLVRTPFKLGGGCARRRFSIPARRSIAYARREGPQRGGLGRMNPPPMCRSTCPSAA